MLSDTPAKLGDRLAVRDPGLAPDLGLTLSALLLLGLGDQRRDRSRLALVVERDEHEVRAGAWVLVPVSSFSDSTRTPISSEVVPTSFTDAFTVTVSPTWTGARNDISSIETVTHMPAGVLERGEPGRGVDELHDDAAVDDPRDVGVGDLHQLDQRHLARCHPSGFEIVHVRDSRRRGAGSMPACVASCPSSWSSP